MYAFGERLRVELFGSSHGESVGCVVRGLPKGTVIDMDRLNGAMALRRPSPGIGTGRREIDEVLFEHGVRDDVIVSDSIMIKIPNRDADPSAYDDIRYTPRPGHADLPARIRYPDMDLSGGGPFSGRMTAPLVAAGAICSQILEKEGIRIGAYTRSIGDIVDCKEYDMESIRVSEKTRTRTADPSLDGPMTDAIASARDSGDSVGGIVECHAEGLPIGLGGMWFDSLDSSLARAMLSIPGAKGIEFGDGFGLSRMKGSESNDSYTVIDGRITSTSNHMGGIVGGMSDGMPLVFRVAFKPTSSIPKEQRTIDLRTMMDTTISVCGRHDPCIVPRAVQVVESVASLAILDQLLAYGFD